MKSQLVLIIFWIFASDVCDTICQLLLKFCINSLGWHIDSIKKALQLTFELAKIPVAWLGLMFSIFSLFIWLFVLTRSDLNFAFSADSMRYILIAVASTAVLKEKIGFMRWAGIGTVVCGITLVALG
ncbi:MAG: hypothetical protein HY209_07035 [Candidatus Omnitrophica bacterium]|nr:hypothetical protein [Candidatus Omnitrophota bacterium]